jgi:hypothetical protein
MSEHITISAFPTNDHLEQVNMKISSGGNIYNMLQSALVAVIHSTAIKQPNNHSIHQHLSLVTISITFITMYTNAIIVLLASAFTGALANPTGNSNAGGVARAIYQNAHVRMYGSDTCDDGEQNIQTIDVEGGNSHRCIAVNGPKHSISVTGE